MATPRIGFHVSAFGSANVLAALSACSRHGFEAIECFADTSVIFADRPDEFRALLDICGIGIAGVHSGGMLTAPEFHEAETIEWTRVLDWTRDVGGDYAVYYGGEPSDDPFADMEHAAALLDSLGREAAERGVKFCYEPDARCPFRTRHALGELMSRTDPSLVRLSVDTALLARLELDPPLFLLTYGKRIAVVHVRDLRKETTPDISDDGFVDPGEGTVDLIGVRDTLRTTGYDGWIVGVVARPHVAAARSVENTARFFRDAMGLELAT